MHVAVRTAALVGGVLAVAVIAGCGHQARPHASVNGCIAYGAKAIRQRHTVTRMPPACQGLSKSQINYAVGKAIYEVAGSHRGKAAWRKRAAADGAYLSPLLSSVAAPAASPLPTPPPAPSAAQGGGATADAGLATWLLAEAAGAFLLRGWVARRWRRPRADRSRRGGSSSAVVIGHFTLATAGLGLWCAYLTTQAAWLAWAAFATLVPVAGLGMGTLLLWLPGQRLSAGAGPTAGAARRGRGASLTPPAIAIHGLAATATILLVLLSALGAR